VARRDAILNGTERASQVHEDLRLKELLHAGDQPVDVLAAMAHLGLAVIFKPLNGLLGAYLKVPGASGAVITTKRPLHVQRFTAAHELGHHVFQHELSTDRNVGYAARGEATGYDEQELEADAFASEFLMPKWLIAAHVNRMRFGRRDLVRQEVVYQLSLRLAVSYTAMCWALHGHQLLTRSQAQALADAAPKGAKQMAAFDVEPESWQHDVWNLTQRDRGSVVLGGPEDLVVVTLEEHSTSGFAWDLAQARELGLEVRADERPLLDEVAMGAKQTRRLTLQGPVDGMLELQERRSWERRGQALNTFDVYLDLMGREVEGLPRAQRNMLRKAA
jgi:hypothetical protein